MDKKDYYKGIIEAIIENNDENVKVRETVCGGELGEFPIIENKKLKLIYSYNSDAFEVIRSKNKETVIYANKDGKVLRLLDQADYLLKELTILAKMPIENLDKNIQYD